MSVSKNSMVVRYLIVTISAVGFTSHTALPIDYSSAAHLNMHSLALRSQDDQPVLTRKLLGLSTGRSKPTARAEARASRQKKRNETARNREQAEQLQPAERENNQSSHDHSTSPLNTYVATDDDFAIDEGRQRTTGGKWNFFVYIAASNNLHRFSQSNIKQMLSLSTNAHINILVQIDMWGNRNSTRYSIESGKARIVSQEASSPNNATGTPGSLFDFVNWGSKAFPAERTALILWNHGCGILDPHIWGRFLPHDRDDLYYFNPETCLLELDRKPMPRGIAFNDTFQTYLTNKDLREALSRISREVLNGRKIDVVGMDACHMAMAEVGSQIKDSTKYLVASQEVEPGSGWNYEHVLAPFEHKCLTPPELARQIVEAYRTSYVGVTSDYTQSAINLGNIDLLERNISAVANTLVALLTSRDSSEVSKCLRRVRQSCFGFYNHNYIDLRYFYEGVYGQMEAMRAGHDARSHLPLLKQQLEAGISILNHLTVANVSGPSLRQAHGVSIYFPTRNVHSSYFKTEFCRNTSWVDFLSEYIKKAGRPSLDEISYDAQSDYPQPYSDVRNSNDHDRQPEEVPLIIDDECISDPRLLDVSAGTTEVDSL